MTDTADPRPRPQYGEYATPEEQQARIAQPDVTQALEEGTSGAAVEVAHPAVVSAPAAEPAEPAATAVRKRSFDRVATFGLLTYGLFTVVTSFGEFVDYNSYAEQVLSMMNVDASLAASIDGRSWGVAAALVLAVGWFITAALSWMSMSRGRVSWWIPLVGAVVFTLASAVFMLTPLMSDPTVWNAMLESVG
ncbi:DUF6264 family protein (plasmid) [Coraliomargarita sp. W4R53]